MTIALVHWPIPVGTLDRLSGRTTYRLVWMCGADTIPGERFSTTRNEVTCEACQAYSDNVRYESQPTFEAM